MQITARSNISKDFDVYLVPFTEENSYLVSIGKEIDKAIESVRGGVFKGKSGEIYSLTIVTDDGIKQVVLLGLGDVSEESIRSISIKFAKGMKKCKDLKCRNVEIVLNNVPEMLEQSTLCTRIFQMAHYVDYSFDYYKTSEVKLGLEEVSFVIGEYNLDEELREAEACGESANFARDLVNHPSMYMTPTQLGKDAERVLTPLGVKVKVYNKEKIEELKMGSFLAVSKGATEPPTLIVMRYEGNSSSKETIALVGKGITFDTGGYSLKSKMATMHADMGGAGSVIGAMAAIARMNLKANVVAIVAACENKIGPDAYVPSDILYSMSGKTIEMMNADAEGRLTLIDAITYAIREENADRIIDIATLTGAAKGAVGKRTAPVLTNDDYMWTIMEKSSEISTEKIWRLNLDKELKPALKSSVADIKNSNPGGNLGGGTIVASLFIEEFVENKPWVHIDMAPVNLNTEDSFVAKGATGYGVTLLYDAIKLLSK